MTTPGTRVISMFGPIRIKNSTLLWYKITMHIRPSFWISFIFSLIELVLIAWRFQDIPRIPSVLLFFFFSAFRNLYPELISHDYALMTNVSEHVMSQRQTTCISLSRNVIIQKACLVTWSTESHSTFPKILKMFHWLKMPWWHVGISC